MDWIKGFKSNEYLLKDASFNHQLDITGNQKKMPSYSINQDM